MKARYGWMMLLIAIFIISGSYCIAAEGKIVKEIGQKDFVSIEWYKYDKGLAKAKAENKHIFLFFRSKWCKWCNLMEKKTFTDQEIVNRLNKSFIPIKIDLDSKNKDMDLNGKKISDNNVAEMYNIFSFPYLIFLEPDQSNIGVLPGYVEAKDLVLILEYVGDNFHKDKAFEQFLKEKKEKGK